MPKEYPPYAYLTQVLQHCPKAGLTYLKLWSEKNLSNEITVENNKIQNIFFVSKTKFKNDLLLLVNEGLISVNEYPSCLVIEMTGWEFDSDLDLLC